MAFRLYGIPLCGHTVGRWTITGTTAGITTSTTAVEILNFAANATTSSNFIDLKAALPAGVTTTAGTYVKQSLFPVEDMLRVDANMDGRVDKADEQKNLVPGSDRRLAETTRCLILDINNNNSDAATPTSPTKSVHDHVSPDLDAAVDEAEIVKTSAASAPGHLCGHAKVVLHRKLVNILRNNTGNGDHYLWIYRTGDNCVRAHLDAAQPTAFGPFKKRILGLPTDQGTNNQLDTRTDEELKPELFPASDQSFVELPMLLEGVRSGVCELILEIRKYKGGTIPDEIMGTSKVRIIVNVDQLPNADTTKTKALPIAGKNPHFVGVDYGNILDSQPTASIVALRGTFYAEIPSNQISLTRWTPMMAHRHYKLRSGDVDDPAPRSTASFWFGLRTLEGQPTSSQGTGTCWVQAGLLFSQRPADASPNLLARSDSPVQFYLETGRAATWHSNVNQEYMLPGTGSGQMTPALQNWETRGIHLGFVMFKGPPSIGAPRWYVACKDTRPPAANSTPAETYFLLNSGPPAPPKGNVAIETAVDQLHTSALYVLPQVKMELCNSAGFMFGTQNKHGGVSNLQYATTRTGVALPENVDAESFWLWANGAGPGGGAVHNWTAVPLKDANENRPRIQITTGLLGQDNKPAIDLTPASDHTIKHFWHCLLPGTAPNTVEFFDERYWAFPAARR